MYIQEPTTDAETDESIPYFHALLIKIHFIIILLFVPSHTTIPLTTWNCTGIWKESKVLFLWQVSSLGDSIKNSISPDMNQSEAGPEIADDAHLHSGDGKL